MCRLKGTNANYKASTITQKQYKYTKTAIMMIIIIIVITMYCNNHFNGKYWATFGPKLSGSPEDPDYLGTDY
jgi:hypothetical protein